MLNVNDQSKFTAAEELVKIASSELPLQVRNEVERRRKVGQEKKAVWEFLYEIKERVNRAQWKNIEAELRGINRLSAASNTKAVEHSVPASTFSQKSTSRSKSRGELLLACEERRMNAGEERRRSAKAAHGKSALFNTSRSEKVRTIVGALKKVDTCLLKVEASVNSPAFQADLDKKPKIRTGSLALNSGWPVAFDKPLFDRGTTAAAHNTSKPHCNQTTLTNLFSELNSVQTYLTKRSTQKSTKILFWTIHSKEDYIARKEHFDSFLGRVASFSNTLSDEERHQQIRTELKRAKDKFSQPWHWLFGTHEYVDVLETVCNALLNASKDEQVAAIKMFQRSRPLIEIDLQINYSF